jgi:hypothetical protein
MTLACFAGVSACNDIGETIEHPPVDAGSDGFPEGDTAEEADAIPDTSVEESAELEAEPDAAHGDAKAVLEMQSPACAQCALANCESYIHGCDQVAGTAYGDSASGTPRSVLCSEALSCMLTTGCADKDQKTCVCGPFTVTGRSSDCTNFPETATGPCKSVFERDFEASAPSEIIGSFTDLSKGGGWATLLYRCLFNYQCNDCFPEQDGGADGGD